jgi:methionyl-tRNA formyltransferase
MHLHGAAPAPNIGSAVPAHFAVEHERLLLGFAQDSALEVHELQVEGKKRMSARDFINGYRPRNEEALGN